MESEGTLDRADTFPRAFGAASATASNEAALRPKITENNHPPRFRQTLSVRPELERLTALEENLISGSAEEFGSEILLNESVISSNTDRYGFITGADNNNRENEDDDDVENDENEGKKKKRKESTAPELEIERIRKRELKWLEMMKNWDAAMLRNYKKVRERCRKGIPGSIRSRAWLHLSGAQYYLERPEHQNEFRRLYKQRGNQRWIEDIEKDLHRNFPTHEMFGGIYEKIGQTELYHVLKAYSVQNPVDGYCQAMAPLAALLLMHMPAEQAFWTMVMVCDKYIPGYYSPGMEAIQLDGDILHGLLKKVAPGVFRHFKKQGVEPILYMTEWFLCVFARTLPWPSVLRVWDMFMCEGVKVLFRVALVLLKFSLPRSVRKKCPSMYETLDILKNLPAKVTEERFLVEQVLKLNVTEEQMEREHRKQLKRREEERIRKQRERDQRTI